MTNFGCSLDLEWVNSVSVNAWCLYENVEIISKECHKLKGIHRAAWLLKCVSCLDLTTLSGDDTSSNVSRLTYKAANPISSEILNKLQFKVESFTTAAVCVYPARIKDAVSVISNLVHSQRLPVAAVSAGFPSGQFSLSSKLQQVKDCLDDGATEIDIVIDRSMVLAHEWERLYDELQQIKKACGRAKLKTILSAGELGNYRNVYKASLVAMMAGSDFIKTSTGKEAINATFPIGIVMMRAIQDYYCKTNYKVGFKAAGGIKTANDALNWLVLVKKKLGNEWLNNSLFRIGASSLLLDIERELYVLAFNKTPYLGDLTVP